MKSTDLILSVSGKEFKQFFTERLLPVLLPLEKKIKRSRFLHTAMSVVVILSMLTVTCAPTFITNYAEDSQITFVFISSYIIFSAIFLISCFSLGNKRNKMKMLIKNKTMPILFSYWDNFEFHQTPLYSHAELYKLLTKLKMPLRTFVIDDCIKGEYNDLTVKIIELIADSRTDDFSTLMLEVRLNKKFTSHTLVKTNINLEKGQNTDGLKVVTLEDVEFEKEFQVYSNNQVDARYILTPTFMERLAKFKRAKSKSIEIAFYRQKAYFFIPCRKDMFEIPIDKPITDFAHYQNVLAELAQILALVDALKLEQKIGL